MTTLHPFAKKAKTVANPKPEAPPVTKQTVFWSNFINNDVWFINNINHKWGTRNPPSKRNTHPVKYSD